ncbi:uncharacterized protein LOC117169789 [Belonocnema kinseyi]|uniref:uncharacterized protein LOC117169789 n=1 Tax=Belonocnema kinseyi TaxID=2817044 RepID=UPI00143D2996|nr:uncharacterized protein LOC117169789 [Belonocnema kinseyi]
MGDLPKDRTLFERPFKHAGIDFCGPFFIKKKKYRNRVKVKIYAAVFVCFVTKAVHIEIVSDLTSEAFLACLRTFFARRRKSSDLYSDNATNFKGAKREIDELYQFLKNQRNIDEIAQHLANRDRVAWHFIPPRSPHFGGLWEAAVKSFKHHFTRAIDGRVLTYEEFTTFATEVEGILNSRPITPVPSDPNDFIALTPGHFSWSQHFWARWKRDYLHEMTVRKK